MELEALKRTSTPLAPADPNTVVLWVGSDGVLRSIDSTSAVRTYSTGISPEEVQDIIGNSFQDSAAIKWTYNDAGNYFVADIDVSKLSHSGLKDLDQDTHTQYLNEDRGDARYYGKQAIDSAFNNILTTLNQKADANSLPDIVRGTVLTGINFLSNSVISATDTVLTALGRLQKQISDLANSASQHFSNTSNPHSTTKAQVGLGSVDNTSDANKPISSATQTALDSKEGKITGGTTSQYWRGDKSWQTLDKSSVGLSAVDNTSDVNKPISNATQTALDGKSASNHSHALATSLVAGFLSSADKIKLDSLYIKEVSAAKLVNTSNTVLTNITELQFNVVAGVSYKFEMYLLFQSVATTTGIAVTFSTPSGTIVATVLTAISAVDGNLLPFYGNITASGDIVLTTGVQAANSNQLIKVEGVFKATANGVVVPQFRSKVNASAVTISVGSFIEIREF